MSNFDSVGKMALKKLQQYQAKKTEESESTAKRNKNCDNLAINTSMLNGNEVSPNSKHQFQVDKSPGLIPTPLNNPFRVCGGFPWRQPKVSGDLTHDGLNLFNTTSTASAGFQLINPRKFSFSHNTSNLNSNSREKEKEADVESSPPPRMSDRKPLPLHREETFASVSAAKESEQLLNGAANML